MVTGSSRKVLRGPTPKASLHLLHISCSPCTCSPVPPSVPSSLVIAREVSRSWTLHNDAGDVISLDGHRARRPLRYSMNLRFPTVSACLQVELWLCSARSTRSLQELACHFRHSLHSLTAHTRHMGPLVSISSPTPCSRRPWTVWCWSALFSDGHPSLVAACGLSSLGSRLASSSMARSRSPLQCPLHSRSCASLHVQPFGIQLQRRFWHGSMVGTRPTWPRSMPRWTGSPAQRRCAFVCVLHQSSRRPHPLSVVLPRLCRLAYPVVCSSPRGTNRSLFMDAALLDFQSAGFGEHPLRCARTHPVCWSGVCPRRLLQTGTC